MIHQGGYLVNDMSLVYVKHVLCVCLVAQSYLTLCDPMDCIACQAPLSMGFSRPEYWSGLPCPPPGDLPDPGIETRSAALQADFLQTEPPGKHVLKTPKIKAMKCGACDPHHGPSEAKGSKQASKERSGRERKALGTTGAQQGTAPPTHTVSGICCTNGRPQGGPTFLSRTLSPPCPTAPTLSAEACLLYFCISTPDTASHTCQRMTEGTI